MVQLLWHCYNDPTDPKSNKEFLKDFDKPAVKGMILDGQVFQGKSLKNCKSSFKRTVIVQTCWNVKFSNV